MSRFFQMGGGSVGWEGYFQPMPEAVIEIALLSDTLAVVQALAADGLFGPLYSSYARLDDERSIVEAVKLVYACVCPEFAVWLGSSLDRYAEPLALLW